MRSPRLSELLRNPPTEKALAWVREMRGADYQHQYLRCRLWREVIRPKVMERDHYTCTVCERAARHVHHLSYDEITLLGHDLTKLKCVCEKHHEAAHHGTPELRLDTLSQRFTEVVREQRAEDKLRAKFNAKGGRLFVSGKLHRSWWTCHFRWDFAPRLAAVADYAGHAFYSAAYFELGLKTHNRNPRKKGGNRFKSEKSPHTDLIFFFDSFSPPEGIIKLRAKRFPDWVAAMKTLTSRHEYPVIIVRPDGTQIVRSGGMSNHHPRRRSRRRC
jgi:hypothetical protein